MGSSSKRKGGAATAAAAAPAPENRFLIEAEIGSGAQSTVYRANDTLANREVALKILNAEIPTEWDVIRNLSHPNIIKLYDSGKICYPSASSSPRPYVAMELLDGVPLKQEIRHLRDWEVSKDIVKECCRALAAAHSKGVIHQDVKPSNVFLKKTLNGQVLAVTVLDFGLATRLPSHGDGVLPEGGTYAYMSPEQIRGEKLTEASDVFSLGVLAYELLTQRHPFTSDVEHATYELLKAAICSSIPEPIREINPSVPESVVLIIHKTLAKDPGQRPTAMDLIDFLDRPEVLQRERRECDAKLKDIRAAFERGKFAEASQALEELERRGLAFASITQLRREINASQADQTITGHVNAAREALQLDQSDEKGREMALVAARAALGRARAVESRRFDVRVLQLEAELDFRVAERAEVTKLLDAANAAFASGARRSAKWLLDRIYNLAAYSPYGLEPYWDGAAPKRLADEIENTYSLESACQGGDYGAAEVGASVSTVPALRALALEQHAKRRRDVLERALELVDHFREGAPDGATELEEMRKSETGDPINEVLALYRERTQIVTDLKDRIKACEQHEDIESVLQALDAVESLQSIAPSPEQQGLQKLLETRASGAIQQDELDRSLKTLKFVAQVGEWRIADIVARNSRSSRGPDNEVIQWRTEIKQRLANLAERDLHVEHHLERLRHSDLDGAIGELSSARDLDPENQVFSVSLASLLLQKAKMLERRPEADVEVIELAEKAKAFLAPLEPEHPLGRAASELLGLRYEEDRLVENAPPVASQQPADAGAPAPDTPTGAGPITNVDPRLPDPNPPPSSPTEITTAPPRRALSGLRKVAGQRWLIALFSAAAVLALFFFGFPLPHNSVPVERALGTAVVEASQVFLLAGPSSDTKRLMPLPKGKRVNLLGRLGNRDQEFIRVQYVQVTEGLARRFRPPQQVYQPGYVRPRELGGWYSDDAAVALDFLGLMRPSEGAPQATSRQFAEKLKQFAVRFPGTSEADQTNLERARLYLQLVGQTSESCDDWKNDLASARDALSAMNSARNEGIGDLQKQIENAEAAADTPCAPPTISPVAPDERRRKAHAVFLEAGKLFYGGDFDGAMRDIKQCLTILPNDHDCLGLQGQIERLRSGPLK